MINAKFANILTRYMTDLCFILIFKTSSFSNGHDLTKLK